MTITLENSYLQLTIDPAASAGWSLNGGKDGAPLVHGAQLGASYYAGNRHVRAMLPLGEAEICGNEMVQSPHGLLNQLQLKFGREQNGLVYSVDFALPEGKPMLLWRLKAENKSRVPVHIDSLELFKAGRLEFPVDSKEPSSGSCLPLQWLAIMELQRGLWAGRNASGARVCGFYTSLPTSIPRRGARTGQDTFPAICSPCSARGEAGQP